MSGKLLCFQRITLHPIFAWDRPREGLNGFWKQSRSEPEVGQAETGEGEWVDEKVFPSWNWDKSMNFSSFNQQFPSTSQGTCPAAPTSSAPPVLLV